MKTQIAEAHSFAPSGYSSGKQQAAPTGVSEVKVAVLLPAQNDDDGCKDGCCTSSMTCCVAMLSNISETPIILNANGIVGFSNAALPQGPPLTLLRPPKFAA